MATAVLAVTYHISFPVLWLGLGRQQQRHGQEKEAGAEMKI
jgi:hypothetical protein